MMIMQSGVPFSGIAFGPLAWRCRRIDVDLFLKVAGLPGLSARQSHRRRPLVAASGRTVLSKRHTRPEEFVAGRSGPRSGT
jgi:hypothetical protein